MKKISEILSKEFKTAPTLSEFVEYVINNEDFSMMQVKSKTKFGAWRHTVIIIDEYNKFLKKPIELSMLVPFKDGEVLERPKIGFSKEVRDEMVKLVGESKTRANELHWEQYQKAKEEVLFSGEWVILGNFICKSNPYYEIDIYD